MSNPLLYIILFQVGIGVADDDEYDGTSSMVVTKFKTCRPPCDGIEPCIRVCDCSHGMAWSKENESCQNMTSEVNETLYKDAGGNCQYNYISLQFYQGGVGRKTDQRFLLFQILRRCSKQTKQTLTDMLTI